MGVAILFLMAVAFERPEFGFLVLYPLAREIEICSDRKNAWYSTSALWLTGVGMLLFFLLRQAWASVTELLLALLCMWAAGVGHRRHPGAVVWILVPVALASFFPTVGWTAIAVHGGLVSLLLLLAWKWSGDSPDASAQMLAMRLGGYFDLARREIHIDHGGEQFVGILRRRKFTCTGPVPPRTVEQGASVTLRTCDCARCRRVDPKGESRIIRVNVGEHTVTIAHRGFDLLARSVHQSDFRALLHQLVTLPYGKVILTGDEMMLHADAAPSEVRLDDSRTAKGWSCRTGEQLFHLAFALHDYLERTANQAYR